jgi:F5/8 type C domain
MATVGQALTAPEAGWKRYDDTHPGIKYVGTWSKLSNASAYSGSITDGPTYANSNKILFNFKGTKLRFITFGQTNRNSAVNIKIDGVTEVFSERASVAIWQMLAYEKAGLSDSIHTVEIWSDVFSSNDILTLDAIDIDSTGRLLHPDEVTDPKDLAIGRRIRCNYKAPTSGQVGTFTGLGQETADFIPPASSATPSGDFYFIMLEDWSGEKRLAADRNVQHSISWDTLNSAGIASGSGVSFYDIGSNLTKDGNAFANPVGYNGGIGANAFDNNPSTRWDGFTNSFEVGIGTHSIGYDFVTTRHIEYVTIYQATASGDVSSLKVQQSDDNSTWIDVLTKSVSPGFNQINLPSSKPARYWRLLSNSGVSGGAATGWSVYEIEMMEKRTTNSKFIFTTRLLTGGTSSTDKDNEWDQYIVSSSLNGALSTPGSNDVWNWSGISSWTSTTLSSYPDKRVIRGNTAVSTHSNFGSAFLISSGGFRPVLTIESIEAPKVTKYLFEDNGELMKWVKGSPSSYLADVVPVMTSGTTSGTTVTESGNATSNYAGWKLFDGQTAAGTYGWMSPVSTPNGWIDIQLPEPKLVTRYTLTTLDGGASRFPKDWKLEAWNGSQWIVLDQRANSVVWANAFEKKVFDFNNSTPYGRYRLSITANNGDANYVSLAEMELIESVPSTSDVWLSLGPAPATEELFKGEGHDNFEEVNASLVSSFSVPLQDRGTLGVGQMYGATISKQGITLKTGKVK